MQRTKLESWIQKTEGVRSLDRADIEALQLRKLNALLERCRARGGFYQDLPARLRSLAELAAVKFTTAEDIAACGGAMLLVSQSAVARISGDQTSGTSGKVKRVFYTAEDRGRTAGFFAAGISEFCGANEKVMVCMPFSGRDGLGELIARAVESLGGTAIQFGVGRSYGEMLETLEREAPDSFIGMPVSLLSMLRMARRFDVPIPVKKALVSADILTAAVRVGAEQILGSKLFPHYGLRECGLGGAVTCPAHDGMHVRENDIIAEIVDAQGNPVPTGDWGELVITTIGMEAMPLVRYKTGDITRLIPGECACGSALVRLDSVSRKDSAKMPAFDQALFTDSRVIDYSVRRDPKGFHFEILVAEPLPNGVIQSKLNRLTPNPPRISVKTVTKDCGPLYTGKRFVISGENN